MTPAPSSKNKRSSTLANIPPPTGPPPPPPQSGHSNNHGHGHGHSYSTASHSSHSSHSSQSGQLNVNAAGQPVYPGGPSSLDPPRASFSSSRASPVGRMRSGRERERERDYDSRSDSEWRSIFDAALVKAQQAVQLDELQETTLAANLYAQAANDLGRQAIYLDRVAQLREALSSKNVGIPAASSYSAVNGDDGGYNHRYSTANNQSKVYEDEFQQYPHQQYQQQPQQQRYQQPRTSQQYHTNSLQQTSVPLDQHHHHHHQQQQQYVQQQVQQPEPQQQIQQDKGFRLFGKKRSKTQPSAPQPPEFDQSFHVQDHSESFNNQRASGINHSSSSRHAPYGSTTSSGFVVPYAASPRTPSPSPIVVSPMFMTHPPEQSQVPDHIQQQIVEQPSKSSKWKPFGKKKSKSVSTGEAGFNNPHRESTQVVPAFSPTIKPVSGVRLVDPSDHADVYSHQKQADWYVEDVPADELGDELQYEDRCYDEDEDIDPFYIADTKGRAQTQGSQKIEAPKEEPQSKSRNALKQNPSVPPQEQILSTRPPYSQPETAISPQVDDQDMRSSPLADEKAYTSNYTDDGDDESVYYNVPGSSFLNQQEDYQQQQEQEQEQTEEELQHQYHQQQRQNPQQQQRYHVEEPYVEEDEEDEAQHFYEVTNEGQSVPEHVSEIQPEHVTELEPELEPELDPEPEKTKTKRTWYGKKKKDKSEKKKKEKEIDLELQREHIDDVARFMEEAMFGSGPPRKPAKPVLKESASSASITHSVSPSITQSVSASITQSVSASITQSASASITHSVSHSDEKREEPQGVARADTTENESTISTEAGGATQDGVGEIGASDTQKRTKSRSFGIFRSKKKKDSESQPQEGEEGSPLTPTVTNEDTKSTHSHHTRQSTQSNDRYAIEMAAALAVRPREKPKENLKEKEKEEEKEKEKEDKGEDSDEYVPYEYQEDLEGPLMERVEVKENREVIGFVMPVEEIKDYTLEDHQEAALENWDSWVSQLESFEKVLSDKGLKKDKGKSKKVKKPKESSEDTLSPLGSAKANRSGIFSLGRSDTVRSRSSTLDLPSNAFDSRPLSMSTTLMDDASIAPRQSFQSSRSGGSEAPSQFTITPIKKRWWSTKRRDTSSMYQISTTMSMADLEQDKRLSSLLQVRSSENLTLNTQLMSMPITLTEPSTPAPELSKEAPAAMETVPKVEEKKVEEKKVEEKKVEEEKMEEKKAEEKKAEEKEVVEKKVEEKKEVREEGKKKAQESEDDEPIAPLPKVKAKAKSSKPKLLPISTPLAQLLEMDSAEELWQYVQQAKTYATTRMNKGDKRSAAIALKRAQALEARWQEILLEMESSDENTDGLLEDDDDEEEEESEQEEEVVVVPAKKEKKKEAAPVVVTSPTPAATPITPAKTTVVVNNTTPNTHNDIEEEDEDDDEEESYAAQRRRTSVSRSSSTPDKYSKYKVNKSAASGVISGSISLTIVAEEETNEDGELAVKGVDSEGLLGPDATLEQMLESSNTDHLAFYIQRMKTDTVAKARSGSKFAALEGMKNVKVLQQRLDDLLEGKDEKGEEEDVKEAKEE
ncbi:hypothetical protein BGX26_012542 [Mortierella sp. AD094]|nr:hypothetical protein BGX26_012542 [Mortierella sp. AD094]